MRKLATAMAAALLTATAGSAVAATAVVYQNDFNTSSMGSGVVATITGPSGAFDVGGADYGGLTGRFLQNGSTDLTIFTLSNLPAHTSLDVDFTLVFLDSWDSIDGGLAPDYLEIYLDGALFAKLTANNASGSTNDFAGGAQTHLSNFIYSGWNDRVVDMSGVGGLSFAHTASTFTLGFRAGGAGWQGGADESWGVDNLKVTATLPMAGGVPEPSTWALLILGFGAAGAMMRRRGARAAAA
ncbi:PEPxxWA-CTERM sorting domain-containing protein [Phenylobacterium sp.]|uniref:PEPxxWA-CTERM sorting domain-containing protein n=1 Tax=Phenylobacterium sp. TaxID=1871053 RepID=UPI003D29503C